MESNELGMFTEVSEQRIPEGLNGLEKLTEVKKLTEHREKAFSAMEVSSGAPGAPELWMPESG